MERTATTWTCDRCGVTEETRQGEQPMSWSTLTMTTPPRAEWDPKKFGNLRAHLCRECTRCMRGDGFERLSQDVEVTA